MAMVGVAEWHYHKAGMGLRHVNNPIWDQCGLARSQTRFDPSVATARSGVRAAQRLNCGVIRQACNNE